MNPQSKPLLIDKGLVYEAYLEVRSKEGAGGVDGVTIEQTRCILFRSPVGYAKSAAFRRRKAGARVRGRMETG